MREGQLGHSHGRSHAPCDVSSWDPSYPYSGGSIGVYGLDMRTDPMTLFDPATYSVLILVAVLWIVVMMTAIVAVVGQTSRLDMKMAAAAGASSAPKVQAGTMPTATQMTTGISTGTFIQRGGSWGVFGRFIGSPLKNTSWMKRREYATANTPAKVATDPGSPDTLSHTLVFGRPASTGGPVRPRSLWWRPSCN